MHIYNFSFRIEHLVSYRWGLHGVNGPLNINRLCRLTRAETQQRRSLS